MWVEVDTPNPDASLSAPEGDVSKGGPLVPRKDPKQLLRQRSIGLRQDTWDQIQKLAESKGYERYGEYLRLLIERALESESEG